MEHLRSLVVYQKEGGRKSFNCYHNKVPVMFTVSQNGIKNYRQNGFKDCSKPTAVSTKNSDCDCIIILVSIQLLLISLLSLKSHLA